MDQLELAPSLSASQLELSELLTLELEREAEAAWTWRATWTWINGGLTVVQAVGIYAVPKADRGDLAVGAIGSGLSTLLSWVWMLEVEGAAVQARRAQDLPPAQRLLRTRQLYERAGRDERERVTWPWHVANVGLAAVPALIILLAFEHGLSALLTFATGVATGELALLTQPMALAEATAGSPSATLGSDRRLTPRAAVVYALRW